MNFYINFMNERLKVKINNSMIDRILKEQILIKKKEESKEAQKKAKILK